MIITKEIIQKKVWEEFIESTSTDLTPFFQTWNWGEVQKKGFEVRRLGFFNADVLIGLCSIAFVNARRGRYLHARHGPVLGDFEKYFDSCMDQIKAIGKEKNAAFIRISPYVPLQSVNPDFFKKRGFIDSPIHKMDGELCWILDTTKSEDTILSEMRKSHRYLIRKAKNIDIKIKKSTDLKDISVFLSLYKDLSARKHFVPHSAIAEEFEIFSRDEQALLFLAEYDGKIISGALIIFLPKMAIYHHAASVEAYRNIPATYLLQWDVIREIKKRKIPVYNLWGVITEQDSKRHPWQGLSLYKKGFGGELREFVHAQDYPLSPFYWKTYLIDSIEKVRKGY